MSRTVFRLLACLVVIGMTAAVAAAAPGTDQRLTRDFSGGGYVSDYTLVTGTSYTDDVLDASAYSSGGTPSAFCSP